MCKIHRQDRNLSQRCLPVLYLSLYTYKAEVHRNCPKLEKAFTNRCLFECDYQKKRALSVAHSWNPCVDIVYSLKFIARVHACAAPCGKEPTASLSGIITNFSLCVEMFLPFHTVRTKIRKLTWSFLSQRSQTRVKVCLQTLYSDLWHILPQIHLKQEGFAARLTGNDYKSIQFTNLSLPAD